MSFLERLAKVAYRRYLCTAAYEDAKGHLPRSSEIYGEENSVPKDDGMWQGDQVLTNQVLQLRDTLWYYEMCKAISDGDIGRVVEVIKVRASDGCMHLSNVYIRSYGSTSGVAARQIMAMNSSSSLVISSSIFRRSYKRHCLTTGWSIHQESPGIGTNSTYCRSITTYKSRPCSMSATSTSTLRFCKMSFH